jgi:hypothetical protein
MQKLYAHRFVRITKILQELSSLGEFMQIDLIKEAKEQGIESELSILRAECKGFEFEAVVHHIDRILLYLQEGPNSSTVFREYLEELQRRIHDEMETRLFLAVDFSKKDYFENPLLFGLKVADRFPSAIDDIYEAGTCLALDRATACVMHLMRIVEVGLKALALELNLPSRTDWGKHLADIEKELEKRYLAAGHRTNEEQFFSEAAEQIGHIKTAKRNPTMHADRTYDTKRADEILIAVRSFMQHLATRLSQRSELDDE